MLGRFNDGCDSRVNIVFKITFVSVLHKRE